MSTIKGTLRSIVPLPKSKLKLMVLVNDCPVGAVQAGAVPLVPVPPSTTAPVALKNLLSVFASVGTVYEAWFKNVSTGSLAIWKQEPTDCPFWRPNTVLHPVPSTMDTVPVVMAAAGRLAMPLMSRAMNTLTGVAQSQFALSKKRESSKVVRLTGGSVCCWMARKKSAAANFEAPLPPVPVPGVPPVPEICASARPEPATTMSATTAAATASGLDLSDVRSNMRGFSPSRESLCKEDALARTLDTWARAGIGDGLAGVRQGLCHFVRGTG